MLGGRSGDRFRQCSDELLRWRDEFLRWRQELLRSRSGRRRSRASECARRLGDWSDLASWSSLRDELGNLCWRRKANGGELGDVEVESRRGCDRWNARARLGSWRAARERRERTLLSKRRERLRLEETRVVPSMRGSLVVVHLDVLLHSPRSKKERLWIGDRVE